MNQGKITIQEGKKTGEGLVWSEVIGEKEYQYFGEAKEAADAISWTEAEKICGQRLDASHAIQIKSWQRKDQEWTFFEERVLLLFVREEK
jgi:hypothetical protein